MAVSAQSVVVPLLAAALVAAVAYRWRALSASGVAAAITVGTLVVVGAGWWGGLVLVWFFVSSTLLSLVGRSRRGETGAITARGSRRDAIQVLANGGPAAVLALLVGRLPPDSGRIALAAFAGSLAAVAADTWATEVGRFSPTPPRSLVSRRPVPPGTSGGVTLLGTAGSVAGAVALAAIASATAPPLEAPTLPAFGAVAAAGVAGSLADSLLGATLQAAYHCPACGRPTEQRVHRCGTPTVLVAGVPWLTNDAVNLAAALVGAGIAALLAGG